MTDAFPVPGGGEVVVVASAPGSGPGYWAGAPSGAFDRDGSLLIAYRVRSPDLRGAGLVLARWAEAGPLVPLGTVEKETFGAESLERPALVAVDGGWRLYVSCATPGSKHWRIDVLEAGDPAELSQAQPATVFAGSDRVGVKDPVVRREAGRWRAWVCCHPLDEPGEEDRMTTAYATSPDGLAWESHGVVLAGRPGAWDARGARITAPLPDGRFAYDGRATKEENFSERTGIANPAGAILNPGEAAVAELRYLDVVAAPDGGHVLMFERPLPDGSHELCLERVEGWAARH